MRRFGSSLVESMRMAFDAVRSSPARAMLTILGVAIGVFVVVLLASVIHGIRQSMVSDLEAGGVTSITISGATPPACAMRYCMPKPLDENDVLALRARPEVARVAEQGGMPNTVRADGRSIDNTRMRAVGAAWFTLSRHPIVAGRPFSDVEARNGASVAVIDTGLSHLLFDRRTPIGRTITIANAPFVIIGEYADPGFVGQSFFGPGDLPSTYFAGTVVPFRTAHAQLGTDIGEITVRPRDGISREATADVVTAVLRAGHELRPRDPNDFEISSPTQQLAALDAGTKTLRLSALLFASVGLLVGGVGVVAIMLISVTERTREIGVRKALGAPKLVIAAQFLVEASVLTVLGAAVGLIAGWLAALAIRRWTPIPASAPIDAVEIALAVSVGVGLLFGLLPAIRAANLNPIDALRYE